MEIEFAAKSNTYIRLAIAVVTIANGACRGPCLRERLTGGAVQGLEGTAFKSATRGMHQLQKNVLSGVAPHHGKGAVGTIVRQNGCIKIM